MDKKEYEMPEEYKNQLAQLTECLPTHLGVYVEDGARSQLQLFRCKKPTAKPKLSRPRPPKTTSRASRYV